MSSTVLKAFVQASRLRGWLARKGHSPALQSCRDLLEKAFGRRSSSHLTTGSRSEVTTPSDLRVLIHSEKARLRAHATFLNVVYSRSSTHVGNSLVEYYPCGEREKASEIGSIKYIYERNGGLRFAVQHQLPVTDDSIVDPFKSYYPDFPAALYSSRLGETLEEVNPEWVLGHYARWQWHSDLCVVLHLSKVCISALLLS